MILGFISFGVLMTIQFGSADAFVQKYLLMFELGHVWIFTVGVLYALTSTLWLVLGSCFKSRWTRWSAMNSRDLRLRVRRMKRENAQDIGMKMR